MATARALDTRASRAWLRRFARTTPGVIGIITVVVTASCVVAGVVCAAELNRRISEHHSVLERSEPFAYAAQNLHAALSSLDATAASAYLSAGSQTPPIRAQYQQALAGAASALADATAGATDVQTRTAVAEISAQLATYTGLVEAARANNLQGNVIGSAYFREASSLMQATLLPGAENIYRSNLAVVEEKQRSIGSAPATGLALFGVALAAVAVGSLIMFRRTNRQFNLGLVAAASVVLLAMVWIVVATRLVANDIEQSRRDGTAQFERLAGARILAQRARTDETLELVTRGDLTTGEESFHEHIDDLAAHLAAGPETAAQAVQRWVASHGRQVEAAQRGDYSGAVAQAIGSDPSASAAQFGAVESSLLTEIKQTRATLRDEVSSAGRFLAWSPTVALVLMMVAASAAVAGLWPRLKEFL
jgi:hypothetical protein